MPVTLNGTSGLTYPDGTVQNTVGYSPWRNRIINGDMRIDQRNNGSAIASNPANASAFPVDRFSTYGSVAGKFSTQQNQGSVTPPSNFSNYLGVTSLSANSPASGDNYIVYQWIEGYNITDLAWGTSSAQTVTLSFWVRSSVTGQFSGSLVNGSQTRGYAFAYTINTANTWEQKTITVSGDTTGTWATNNNGGIGVILNLGCGSTRLSTANSWQTFSNLYGVTGSVNLLGTSGATFYLTGVQLEAGTATPFERVDYSEMLRRCQRFFEAGSYSFYAYGASSESFGSPVYFRVTKRAVPSITFSGISNINNSGLTATDLALDKFTGYATGTATARQALLYSWNASAEL